MRRTPIPRALTTPSVSVGGVYAAEGTLITPGGVLTPNSAIRQSVVTLVQFSKNIQIPIIKVVVEGNRFTIRWDWMERDAVTGAPHFASMARPRRH